MFEESCVRFSWSRSGFSDWDTSGAIHRDSSVDVYSGDCQYGWIRGVSRYVGRDDANEDYVGVTVNERYFRSDIYFWFWDG